MRSFLLILLSVISIDALARVEVSVSQTGGREIDFSIDSLAIEEIELQGKSFTKVELAGVEGYKGIDYQIGAPQLPVIRLYTYSHPQVTFNGAGKFQMLNKHLVPSQKSVVKLPRARIDFDMDLQKYQSNEFYPQADYKVEKAGSIRGQQRYLLTIYPVKYNPMKRIIEVRSQFSIRDQMPQSSEPEANNILFVVGAAFENSPSLQRYRDFHHELGNETEILVYGNGIENPNELRDAIQRNYHSSGTTHIIIVGDASDVPGKSARHISGTTDHFYRAIDTEDYESDINGPDVRLARISVSNESQLEDVVDKFISYQRRTEREFWQNQVSFIATDDRRFYRVSEGTHDYVIDTWTRQNGYVGDYPSARSMGGDKLYAIGTNAVGSDVFRMMSEGRNFIIYSGHGYNNGWAGPNVGRSDIKRLQDASVNPFVIGFACDTGDYRQTETFAEVWLRHPAGAISYWGSMDSSYWDEDDIMEKRLFDKMFAGEYEIGSLFNHSLEQVWAHYGGAGYSKYYWESYTAFTDPSINIRVGHQ